MRKPSTPTVVALLLIFASGLVYKLSADKVRIRKQYVEAVRAAGLLKPGNYVPPFTAISSTGSTKTVGETTGHNEVVMILRRGCQFCQATLPQWRQIADRVRSKAEVVAVSLDDEKETAAFVSSQRPNFDVVRFPHRKYKSFYRIRSTPTTIVLASDGRVLFTRVGQISRQASVDSVVTAAVSFPLTGQFRPAVNLGAQK